MKLLLCLSFFCFWWFQLVFSKEFCNSEVFQPICAGEKIIHVTNAIYGRRKYGMCLEKEGELNKQLLRISGYMNCSTDVRHIIEPQCAGQQRCEVPVARIEAESGCSKAFKDHLDIEYSCKKGDMV